MPIEVIVCGVSISAFHASHAAWLCCKEAAARATDLWCHRLHDADELGLSKFAHAVERFNGYFNLSHTTSVIA
jgi:hypothetical protein